MQTKIEVERTYWVGMTSPQVADLQVFLEAFQRRDVDDVCKRLGKQDTDSIFQTLVDLQEALTDKAISAKVVA